MNIAERVARGVGAIRRGLRTREGVNQASPAVASEKPADLVSIRYLAYAEQIPRDWPVYIVGLDGMARWTLRLLRSRGYAAEGFVADNDSPPARFEALPVIPLDRFRRQQPENAAVLIASAHRDQLIHEFPYVPYVFDVTELYQFVTAFCDRDPEGVLLDDLGISYWRLTPEQADRIGATWRKLKKIPTHRYVRNIDERVGAGHRFVVNIGCHDGISSDPCYPLYRDGWGGWALDAVDAKDEIGRAAARNLKLPGVTLTLGTSITPSNASRLLAKHDVPVDCDLIKVDINSHDGPVIKAILEGGWRPRVFCIEVNADLPPPFRFMLDFDKRLPGSAHLGLYGCSAAWAADLFDTFGYRFAQYEFGFPKMVGGVRDMVFVRNDVFAACGAAADVSWDDAYYAEPLAWSHIKGGLKLDPREWRHATDPEALAVRIEDTIRRHWEEIVGRRVPFSLTV